MTHKQMTLSAQADAGFDQFRKPTRRDVFLSEMDKVVPWSELCAAIEPHYPKVREDGSVGSGGGGSALRFHVDAAFRGH